MARPPRLAVRALIVRDNRLLLVNAYGGGKSDLWCAPGGGVETGTSVEDNLVRELHEETGLTIAPGPLAYVHQFHRASDGFQQVDLIFHADIIAGTLADDWQDPDQVVTTRRFFSESDLRAIRYKPAALPELAFGPRKPVEIGPLVPMAL